MVLLAIIFLEDVVCVMTASESAMRAGTVRFVGLANFMTYRDVSFSPGPGFNIVVRPNGSGKSAIMSAITLCLGGDVSTLGRQSKTGEFVNVAASEQSKFAEIEVHLHKDLRQAGNLRRKS